MHLLATESGMVSDGTEPVDPGQTPADVVFLSAADTELAALSAARNELGSDAPQLRLAQLSWLSHPFTVDKYIGDTCLGSKLVIARCLGGAAYWQYAVEQLSARLYETGTRLALLPGDDKPDEELFALSTIERHDWEALCGYLIEGGPDNSENFLRLCRSILDGGERPSSPRPLLRSGIYWPGQKLGDPIAVGHWKLGAPVVAIVFYRALVQGAGLHPVNQLVRALARRGLNPLPIFVASLKEEVSTATLAGIFERYPPDIVLNATSFAVSSPDPAAWGGARPRTPLDAPGVPVLQVVFSSTTRDNWLENARGLTARDIAMNVALPEVDGRILSRTVSFKAEAYRDEATQCPITTYRADGERVAFVADLAANWVALAKASPPDRKVALILANYPNKDGRLANGVGLDTPAATVGILRSMAGAGYAIDNAPQTGSDLMATILAGPTNWLADRSERSGGVRLPLSAYLEFFKSLPWDLKSQIEERWGAPQEDPFCGEDGFALSVLEYGNVVVGVQPARGYNIDPEDTYHAPDLVPPHNYLAFYVWLRQCLGAHAIVHLGKHGNLEWLPGKAVGLSPLCYPEVALGPIPHIYPFIVNDPGEGTQAKRRSQAVIIDHLTPPLTRAETYGPMRDLEVLVDEYYQAAGLDPNRVAYLRNEILSLMSATGLGVDAGVSDGDDTDSRLQKIDAYLCELKEAQIRDGLHIFGESPTNELSRDLIVALARVPRGEGTGVNASLHRALAADFGMDFDPLDCEMASPWSGPKPNELLKLTNDPWRSEGDTVERLELYSAALVESKVIAPGPASAEVLQAIEERIAPAVAACGTSELQGLLTALDGRFVDPGPSGAPTRGRLDTLPTGRNFFSVDSRSLPTRAAWTLGWKSAAAVIERHMQDQGDWLRTAVLTAWGTSNMRTGGDDIAQAMALMGVRPKWDEISGRVTGFEIIPLGALGRPRVDVTLRISGFFRDAFPAQVDLLSSAARAVMELDEPAEENPAAERFHKEGRTEVAAFRVFGSKPGAYGAGLQAMIDERLWADKSDLADSFLAWGGFAYGSGADGTGARRELEHRLAGTEAVIQNQDNREHDLLDSDDYYQFEGGLAATVETLRGMAPVSYHNDHSRPEKPIVRTLEEEIARVVRSRAANPKWLNGVKRHGYKGAFEIAATVDYMFAFAATTGAVRGHHFDLVYEAYLEDESTREFIADVNAPALAEIAERFGEAIDRGLWNPRSNSARALIDTLRNKAPSG